MTQLLKGKKRFGDSPYILQALTKSSIRDGLPQDFLDLFASRNADPNILSTIRRSFQTNVHFENAHDSWTDSYLMQHMFRPSTGDSNLDSWARERKLFPWVAIAAPLRVLAGPCSGKLFSTLSLHINTQQPVHIHGLFAIAPDRARLGSHDSDVQWNSYMFGSCVAAGWADLISQQLSASPANDSFSLWPRCDITHKLEDIWTSLDDLVLDLIIRNNSEVWQSTNAERISFEQAFFVSDDNEDVSYRKAWEVIGLPAVILTPALFRTMHLRAKACNKLPKSLKPSSARLYLRDKPLELGDAAALVLEFCLLDAIRDQGSSKEIAEDLYDLHIWPMLDGRIKAINRSTRVLLPRSLPESELFRLSRVSSTLSLHHLSSQVSTIMKNRIIFTGVLVRFRELNDLEIDWPRLYCIDEDAGHLPDVSKRDPNQDHHIRDVWTWICDRLIEQSDHIPGSMNDLWLLPMRAMGIRRLASNSKDSMVLILNDGSSLQELFNGLPDQAESNTPPLLESSALSTTAVERLKGIAVRAPDLGITTSERLGSFAYWLWHNKPFLSHSSETHKVLLLKYIEGLLRTQKSTMDLTALGETLGPLPLYNGSHSETPYRSRSTTRRAIPQNGNAYFLPFALPAFPNLPGLNFFDIKEPSERYIVRELQLVSHASIETLLNDHILPWMVKQKSGDESIAKMQLVDWIFGEIKPSDAGIRNTVSTNPIVPMKPKSNAEPFRCLIDLVDPRSESAILYFEDEPVFPANDFFEKHELALRSYGIQRGNESPTLALDRAKVYAERKADMKLLAKVQKLLTSPLPPTKMYQANKTVESLTWLPATMPDGEMRLCSPKRCRGLDQRDLIDEVWGWLPFNPLPEWQSLLGWDVDVPGEILVAQVDGCIAKRDTSKLSKALSKVPSKDYSILIQKSCIQGKHGELMMPSQVFYPGHQLSAFSLLPHMDSVDGRFAQRHKSMLSSLGIAKEPSLIDIQELQATLNSRCPLDASGVSLAIASLEVALRLPDFDRAKLAIPDTIGSMRNLTEIVHGEPVVDGQLAEFHYTNTRVSIDLAERLELETCYERALRLSIEIDEEDDDEFTPREKLADIVSDTLSRYPVEETFNEFLANADDAGAIGICWTVNDALQQNAISEASLTPELQDHNKPSITVYNDASFTEKDFAGFKSIGQGGKKDDATTTGMFGRGVMTMYHFTDVPMLLSAGYLIILDPQQQCLPKNKFRRRKAGVKLPLPRARKLAGAQLAQFNGLHGFTTDMDYFEGTMFRFPLRNAGSHSILNTDLEHIDARRACSLLTKYVDIARQSLLFLQNVSSIEVRIQGRQNRSWKVSTRRPNEWENELFHSAIVCTQKPEEKPCYDLWRIGLRDIETGPPDIQKVGKGFSKVTECGIAGKALAQLTHCHMLTCSQARIQFAQLDPPELNGKYIAPAPTSNVEASPHRVHCKLPLMIPSELPVTFHGSFAITGDRKTVAFEGQDSLSAWNRWLLTECIADFYVDFICNAAPRYGTDTFKLWPATKSHGDASHLSLAVAGCFWNKIGEGSRRHDHLYPLANIEASHPDVIKTNLKRPKARASRVTHPVVTLENAHFNFLPESTSGQMEPLLQMLALNVVRPPATLRSRIRAAIRTEWIAEVGPSLLSQMFREHSNVAILEKHMTALPDEKARSTFFAAFLNSIIPRLDDGDRNGLHILDGCIIVPRPNLSLPLGMLKFNQVKDTLFHLVADTTEQKLFPFASDLFVNDKLLRPSFVTEKSSLTQKDYLQILTQSGANIRTLSIEDLGPLFEKQSSHIEAHNMKDNFPKWMAGFWRYLNNKLKGIKGTTGAINLSVKDFLTRAGLWDKPIYMLSSSQAGRNVYITPAEFDDGPYILEPDNTEQRQLCVEVSALSQVSPASVPFILTDSERNLDDEPSFVRLTKALTRIQKVSSSSLELVLDAELSVQSREVLRNMMLRYLQTKTSFDMVQDARTLQRLPVWPRAGPTHTTPSCGFLSLSNGQLCEHSALFVPWMKNMDKFIEPKIVARYKGKIRLLGSVISSVASVWREIKTDLPADISEAPGRQQHLKLLETLQGSDVRVLNDHVALNGAGILCKPSDLYDNRVQLFLEAFHFEQEKYFLHPDIRPQLTFLVRHGMRTVQKGGIIDQQDFLGCTLTIHRSFRRSVPDADYRRAAEKATEYLKFEKQDFHNWNQENWQTISSVPMFQVNPRIDRQPVYRQGRMLELTSEQQYCSLNEAGRPADIRICWSQYKVLANSPANFVFEQRPGGGSPSMTNVYHHLKYLVSLRQSLQSSEISEYLQDIQACYAYMQRNPAAVQTLPDIRHIPIWFNLDSTSTTKIAKEQLTEKLLPAKLLCLDAPCKPIESQFGGWKY